MATHRRYTAKERAEAVAIAAVEGVTETERRTGIPKNTIQYWTRQPEFVQLRTTAREIVVESFWVGIQIGVREVVIGLRGNAPLHHKADALRTLTEKYALLNGEPTERTETRGITEVFDDHETRAIVRAAQEYVAGTGPVEGPAVAESAAVDGGRPGEPASS